MSDPIIPPPALVQGCNTPHGICVLSDWIEERTGVKPEFHQPGWSESFTHLGTTGCGYGYSTGDGGGDGDGGGYGDAYGDGSGSGCGDGYGNYSGDGNGCGDGYGNSFGGGIGSFGE